MIEKEILAHVEQEFKGERADLIPVLQRIQAIYDYLPREAMQKVARWLKISENEIYGVATFYAQFRFIPRGRHHLKVCLGTACHVKGGEQMLEVSETSPGNQSGRDHARRQIRPRTGGLFGLLRARARGDL